MDLNVVVVIVAAVGAIAAAAAKVVALRPTRRVAITAEEQTEVQRELMR